MGTHPIFESDFDCLTEEMTFTQEEYRYPIAELKTGKPESEEWKLFVDTPEVQVFAWLDPETGYFQWKVFGEIKYSQEILKKVLLDIDYRKTWDSYVGSIEKIEENNNLEIIYWDVKYGVPFVSNRDYVYCRELKEMEEEGETFTVILSKTYESEKELVPAKKGKVRVVGFKQFMAVVKTEAGCKLYFHSVDRPGGNIPTSLINWAAKNGIPNYLNVVKKGVRRVHRSVGII